MRMFKRGGGDGFKLLPYQQARIDAAHPDDKIHVHNDVMRSALKAFHEGAQKQKLKRSGLWDDEAARRGSKLTITRIVKDKQQY